MTPLARTPEPELMDEAEQSLAYAEADFSEPHNRFIALFHQAFAYSPVAGTVLDLGCGPADVILRFARAHPDCRIDGVDGATSMLALGRSQVEAAGLSHRIRLIEGYLPGAELPLPRYDTIISNSLLHHLAEPSVLWQSIRQYGSPGAAVFVMDLRRPENQQDLDTLVRQHAAGESEILQRDFRLSLHAAYRPEEIRQQLQQAGLNGLNVSASGDRHLIVYGHLPANAMTP